MRTRSNGRISLQHLLGLIAITLRNSMLMVGQVIARNRLHFKEISAAARRPASFNLDTVMAQCAGQLTSGPPPEAAGGPNASRRRRPTTG